MNHDVAVVGLGAMGSATAWALARRNASVVAIDQLEPPHTFGSSHGHTRIIREAYYEHPLYVPFVRRAYELWEELEEDVGRRLWLRTGGVMVGAEAGPLVAGATESARRHAIEHELLDAAELTRRFPAYRARAEWVALYERRAGVLFPERCIRAFHEDALKRGATMRPGERVTGWSTSAAGVRVTTDKEPIEAKCLVVAAGPWLPTLAPSLDAKLPLEIERQLSHWFEPSRPSGQFGADRCPIGLWETRPDDVFATIPDEGHGVKCGMHHAGAATTAESVDRVVSPAENEGARRMLEEVMPGAGGTLIESRVCLYTNTPDRHFIIDWDREGRVLVVSPCSGHGFKFASAVGEIVAQLVLDGRSWLDLEPFSLKRFR